MVLAEQLTYEPDLYEVDHQFLSESDEIDELSFGNTDFQERSDPRFVTLAAMNIKRAQNAYALATTYFPRKVKTDERFKGLDTHAIIALGEKSSELPPLPLHGLEDLYIDIQFGINAHSELIAQNIELAYTVGNAAYTKYGPCLGERHDYIAIASEALVKAGVTFNPEKSKFSTYAWATMTYAMQEEYRNRTHARRQQSDLNTTFIPLDDPDAKDIYIVSNENIHDQPEAAAVHNEFHGQLHDAKGAISDYLYSEVVDPIDRHIFLAIYDQGKSLRKIAEEVNLSKSTVDNRLKTLQKQIREEVLTPFR